jgi:hypothetical protein
MRKASDVLVVEDSLSMNLTVTNGGITNIC